MNQDLVNNLFRRARRINRLQPASNLRVNYLSHCESGFTTLQLTLRRCNRGRVWAQAFGLIRTANGIEPKCRHVRYAAAIEASMLIDWRSKAALCIYTLAGGINTTTSHLILEDWLKKSSILKGSALSVLVLAAGAFIEGRSGLMGKFSVVGLAGGPLGLGLAALAVITARVVDAWQRSPYQF